MVRLRLISPTLLCSSARSASCAAPAWITGPSPPAVMHKEMPPNNLRIAKFTDFISFALNISPQVIFRQFLKNTIYNLLTSCVNILRTFSRVEFPVLVQNLSIYHSHTYICLASAVNQVFRYIVYGLHIGLV